MKILLKYVTLNICFRFKLKYQDEQGQTRIKQLLKGLMKQSVEVEEPTASSVHSPASIQTSQPDEDDWMAEFMSLRSKFTGTVS